MRGSGLLLRKIPYLFRPSQFPDLIDEITRQNCSGTDMRRWFLSYTSQDFALMQALKAALQHREADAHIFFAPKSMRAGGFWQQQLADEIAQSTAFVLLVGETGVGPWQVMEYNEALDRCAKEPHYPLILILSEKTAK